MKNKKTFVKGKNEKNPYFFIGCGYVLNNFHKNLCLTDALSTINSGKSRNLPKAIPARDFRPLYCQSLAVDTELPAFPLNSELPTLNFCDSELSTLNCFTLNPELSTLNCLPSGLSTLDSGLSFNTPSSTPAS